MMCLHDAFHGNVLDVQLLEVGSMNVLFIVFKMSQKNNYASQKQKILLFHFQQIR